MKVIDKVHNINRVRISTLKAGDCFYYYPSSSVGNFCDVMYGVVANHDTVTNDGLTSIFRFSDNTFCHLYNYSIVYPIILKVERA